jgi:death-on-curing protein
LQTPEFIEKDVAIAIHDYLIERFGGSLGIRDEGLLESALAQPQATFFGELLHPTIAEQAAAYLYHLAKNHAFVDGNKRVALGVSEAFLRLNGYNLNLSNQDLYELTLNVAVGELEKTELAEVLQAHLGSME